MTQMRRAGLSASERVVVWQRWKRGDSLAEIGRFLDRSNGLIHGVISGGGGTAPPARRRSRFALSLAEREEISRGMAAGDSMRSIARVLERSPSTVSREIARHGGRETYGSNTADERAWGNARRPKRCRLADR